MSARYRITPGVPLQVEFPADIRSNPTRRAVRIPTSGKTLELNDAELALVKASGLNVNVIWVASAVRTPEQAKPAVVTPESAPDSDIIVNADKPPVQPDPIAGKGKGKGGRKPWKTTSESKPVENEINPGDGQGDPLPSELE